MNDPVLLTIGMLACGFLATTAFAGRSVPYGVAEKPWNARWGNHRARVRVRGKADAVRVHLPWRRRDLSPEDKAVFVIHAASGRRVVNVVRVHVNREFGDLVFRAAQAGEYHVYYMPFTVRGRAFPTTVYNKPKATAEAAWLKRNGLTAAEPAKGRWESLPAATVVEFQARRAFDRMDPMEVIATAAEVKQLVAGRPRRAYLLFPEDRRFPIRMTDDLPERWIRRGPAAEFHGRAMRNEFYVFQIGVYACRHAAEDLGVSFTALRPAAGGRSTGPAAGKAIPASALRCFNTGGVDWLGRPMRKGLSVPPGKVQALWIGVDVPADAAAGVYNGSVTIQPRGGGSTGLATGKATKVRLALTISSKALADRGDGELWRMSRLRWLDSRIGLEDEVTAPYTPLAVEGATVQCLGRSVTFGPTGLPRSIRAGKNELLTGPVAFAVLPQRGPVEWKGGKVKITRQTAAAVTWESVSQGGPVSLRCRATMEFDGYVNFQLALQADRAVDLKDSSLEIPIRPRFATYLMGMGHKGGFRPKRLEWKWAPARHQDSVWIGDVAGGLQCKLKGPNYRWPLVNIHYRRRPLLMPEAWHNAGKGGCTVQAEGKDRVVLRAYGGPRRLAAGQELRFDFGLLITPVKPLNTKAHWTHRYYHGGAPAPQRVAETGARIINIHHANEINPFINYPFLRPKKLRAYVDAAHDRKLKVKLYYTIRELTNHVAELWALRSLGHEIFPDGPGGGYAWLHEHLVGGYSPAWHHRFADGTWCAAISQTGLSRWHNYYVEGLAWLAGNMAIDGLYLDEIGYDREIMKRVRRVLDKTRPGSLLDLHSWNHLNARAGYANCLNLYLEHMPYLDSLWIGEARDYNEPPDHWMVEISGIPFGVMSEMLQGGGNPWRGMLYGMTSRLPWSGDPRAIWKLWDAFGIQDAQMLGYWSDECPVRTGRRDVPATVYRRKHKALIALASWAKGPVKCGLKIDWKALGLDPAKARLRAAAVGGLQAARSFRPAEPIPVKPGGGWMLILDQP